jgi:hypothetical protein
VPKRLIITPSRIAAYAINEMQTTLRGRNALINVFELWVGLAGVISGIVFFYSPASLDDNSVAHALGHSAAILWIIGYTIGGLLLWYGLIRPSPKWEVVGLWMLGTATAWNAIAIVEYFGLRAVASAATLVALTVAAWTRALIVQTVALNLIKAAQGDDGP